ncbi:MAG TPA: biotin/lipoyl-containing protein [Spirochaetia bacterium]|nr:biotin/lipoyl-containing protein [Spirochaetia bacterium]
MKRSFKLRFEGEEMTVTVERQGNDLVVARDGRTFTVSVLPVENSAAAAGRPESRGLAVPASTQAAVKPRAPAGQARPNAQRDFVAPAGAVTAPITGTIKEVLVSEGESISQGDRVMMMEAMKMDIEIVAPSAGKLSHVFVKAGDSVKEHQPLFNIE